VRPSVASASAGRGAGWALIEAAQAGDRDAFGQLYARYADGVSRFVGNRLRDRGAVEDLTSETFTRALRRIDSVSDQGRDVGAWFTTIARNLVLDHVKSSRHRLETFTAEITDARASDASPEQAVIEKDTAADLHRHVARLPAAQQECIRRRFMQELSVAETAAAMGRGEGAVKALQHRAIVGLRAAMTGDNTAPVASAREAADRELPAQRGGLPTGTVQPIRWNGRGGRSARSGNTARLPRVTPSRSRAARSRWPPGTPTTRATSSRTAT
jgi:RNA polymerase sigma-70 factor, ECF subfamily